MSLISLGLIAGAAKNSGGAGFEEPGPIAYAIYGVMRGTEMLGEAFGKIRTAIVNKAQKNANIKEFKEVLGAYSQLSKGKEGKVEVYKSPDGKTSMTIIHTENGPFVRTEKTHYGAKNPDGSAVRGTSVSFTGIRTVTDKQGKETLAFINEAEQGVSLPRSDLSRDNFFSYNTGGQVLTETGEKNDLHCYTTEHTEEYVAPPAPTVGTFGLVQSVEQDFNAELEKLNVQVETVVQATPVATDSTSITESEDAAQ